jgi:hypothetical protein
MGGRKTRRGWVSTYHTGVETGEHRLARAMCLVFESDADPLTLEAPALRLLAAERRGESEIALRHQVAKLQSRTTGRVHDMDCRQVVALIRQAAARLA